MRLFYTGGIDFREKYGRVYYINSAVPDKQRTNQSVLQEVRGRWPRNCKVMSNYPDNGHRFKKGHHNGRPKGCKNKFSTAALIEAIQKVEREEGISFLKHLVERALKSDKMAVSLIKKILPDLTHELGDQEKTLIINYQQAKQVEAPDAVKNAEIVNKERASLPLTSDPAKADNT